ncbi:LysR family transcriptional regulator substrate-binding protein [Winkia neuii]|nr:LysR family transcriptional regulator substrate-binding protein [Winkia neuii]WEB57858.1 LysR family transcriptional regulator substrate-binding protein [Winkia neuii]
MSQQVVWRRGGSGFYEVSSVSCCSRGRLAVCGGTGTWLHSFGSDSPGQLPRERAGANLAQAFCQGSAPHQRGAAAASIGTPNCKRARPGGTACWAIKGVDEGKLTVGTKHSMAAIWLPHIAVAFRKKHPNVDMRVEEGGTSQILNLLEEGRVDCALLTSKAPGYNWLPLQKVALVAWLPPQHPYADAAKVPVQAFAGAPFVRTHLETMMDSDRYLHAHKVTPDVKLTSADSFTTYAMVEAGLGASLNVEPMTRSWTGNVAVVPVDPPYSLEFGVAYADEGLSPAAAEFIALAKDLKKRWLG